MSKGLRDWSGSQNIRIAIRRCARRGFANDRAGAHDETGAVLLLALAFIIVVSAIVLALNSWATGDLTNTTNFSTASSLKNAVTSATDVAIQSIRYYPIPTTAPPSPNLPSYSSPDTFTNCWTPATGSVSQISNLDNLTISEWCNTQENLESPNTRVVTVAACVGAGATTVCSDPVLTAVVDFDDYPAGGSPTLSEQCNYVATDPCGDGITLASWTWS
ncbi:MAG: hypothetical protein WBL51_03530 [Acidimicrobiales bacterium]